VTVREPAEVEVADSAEGWEVATAGAGFMSVYKRGKTAARISAAMAKKMVARMFGRSPRNWGAT
jgi:hypothetical protein